MWSHAVAGVPAIFIYINSLKLTHFLRGLTVLIIAVPVLVPYAISASYAWQLYTWQTNGPGLIRLAAFIVFLALGSILVDAAILGTFGPLDSIDLLKVLLSQTLCFVVAANLILDRI